MEKNQYSLCEEILRRLHGAGVLDGMVIAGSWCIVFYKEYFNSDEFTATIRTRDIDFAIPIPTEFTSRIDLKDLLADLGFLVDFRGDEGHMRFVHPDLILEFLVPERGRGSAKAFDIPELGANAQRLRYLDISLTDTITVNFRGTPVRLPHPARFALHKLIVAGRRSREKAENDRAQAIMVLRALRKSGEERSIRDVFVSMPAKWRKAIECSLVESGIPDAILLLGTN